MTGVATAPPGGGTAGRTTGRYIAVGASAGGVEALSRLVAALPEDLPATVLVVLHVPEGSPSALTGILARAGRITCVTAADGEPLLPSTVVVAPAGSHLLVADGHVSLSRGPQENGHRPAVDALFRSCAQQHGARTVAVVLTGTLDDGTAGLAAVRASGGVAVVQEPSDALYPGMPASALAGAGADHVVALSQLPALLARLVSEPAPDDPSPVVADPAAGPSQPPHASPAAPARAAVRPHVAGDLALQAATDPSGAAQPAGYSCPDCSGTLYRIDDGTLLSYRCRVGHAWSAESLLARQGDAHEEALWMAARSLQERAALGGEMAQRAEQRGHRLSAAHFRRQAEEASRAAALVRELVARVDLTRADPPEEGTA